MTSLDFPSGAKLNCIPDNDLVDLSCMIDGKERKISSIKINPVYLEGVVEISDNMEMEFNGTFASDTHCTLKEKVLKCGL